MAKRKTKRKATIPRPYDGRVQKLRDAMKAEELDGYLVQDRKDQIWLTGFTGEDGLVLVTQRAVILLTDGRFDEAAEIDAPWAKKVLRKVRTPEFTAKELKRSKLQNVGFEPDHMNVTEYTQIRKHAKPGKLVAKGGLVRRLRVIKDKGEIAAIGVAIDVAQRAFQKVARWIKPGVTERQIAARLAYEMQKLGAQGVSFPTIVAADANGSLPHYEAGDAVVQPNSVVLIDWGAQVDWYTSDLTRMIWVGSIPREIQKIHAVVREAHDRAIAAAQPGMTGHEMDAVARRVITKAGYGKHFEHALGHGMGLDVHESPRLGRQSKDVIEPGMVFTIEPGIYLPGIGGVRLESDVLLTEHGAEVLTTLPY